jgi:hypothetical protein
LIIILTIFIIISKSNDVKTIQFMSIIKQVNLFKSEKLRLTKSRKKKYGKNVNPGTLYANGLFRIFAIGIKISSY